MFSPTSKRVAGLMPDCPRCAAANADGARFCNNCGAPLGTASAAAPEVRKTVTVMFMDVVGSTALGERTDPEQMRRVMTRYFDEIRTVVERHGGSVEKYIGDAVMAVFGVPQVHEDDALRAARAALEIRARLAQVDEDLRRERGVTVAWRTGLNTGEVVAGDTGAGQRFVTGDAVNIAARLEQSAQPGEILVGRETHALIRDAVSAEPAQLVVAKGKSEPLAAYRLLDVAPAHAPGSTAATARWADSPMVGRQRQRRLLAEAYEQVVDERVCHLFTILGAAGVGKSRLVSEFLDTLGDAATVLHGRCLSYGEGITYWAIAEAIRQAAGLTDDDDNEAVRRKLGALIDDDTDRYSVVERIGQMLGRFSGGGSNEEMFWAVRTLLQSLARRRPVVLHLDDVHWAESTLLDLIEHLADWMRDVPMLLLCVARQELLEMRPGWGGGKSYATTITLEPLNQNESRELMVNLLGQVELSPELVDKISASAEGNPLFVEEMIAMLMDSGAKSAMEVTIPPTIQALLEARLDRLPRPERAVIERGSVEGKIFHRGAVAELAPDELRASVPIHLRALARKELVRPDRSDFAGDEAFHFRHLLIRDAAYSGMPKEARADLHARFAEWLSRMAGEHIVEYEEILGYHFEQAYRYRAELGATDEETIRLRDVAAHHLAASGDRAFERGDARAAIKLLGAALDLMDPDDHETRRVVSVLGAALAAGGDLREAEALLNEALARANAAADELGAAHIEVALMDPIGALGRLTIQEIIERCERLMGVFRRHGDERGMDLATFHLGIHTFFAGRAQQSVQIFAERLDSLPPEKEPPRWLINPLFAALYWGSTPVAEAADRAEQIDTSGSPALEAGKLRLLGALRGLVGDFETAREQLQRAADIQRDLGNQAMLDGTVGHFIGPLEILAGDFAAAEKYLLEAFERMTARGDTGFSSTVAGNLAALSVALRRWDDAERFARITLDTSQADDVEAKAQGYSQLARVQASRGEHAEAEANARRAVAVSDQTDYLMRRGETLADLAEVLAAAGRRDEAVATYERAIETFRAKGATALVERAQRRMARVASLEPG